jgi:hypothetical protein
MFRDQGVAILAIVGLLVLASSSTARAAGGGCEVSASWTGCDVSNSGSQVDISGTKHQPGKPSRPHTDNGRGDSTPPADDADDCDNAVECRGNYSVVGLPDVTLADLASFVPARPTLSGEPNGVGVVGMPTNLVARAGEQRIDGTLFEYDVTVRFVPAGFRFAYGDGTSGTTSSGGASWTALGQADFTPTATSHVYRERGTYSASVTVLYSASVDFGGGWRPVPGFVETTGGGYGIRVVEVHTALVDRTCLENPGGPGC